MFYNYQAHSLADLALKMSVIERSIRTDPMQPLWIIVQNNEIKEWLSIRIAEQNGIAGNYKFIFPSEFLWALYRLKDEDIPEALPSDLTAMHWVLFELFGKEPELLTGIPNFNNSNMSQFKRFQLAGQIADVFDQYQVYRPDMIMKWEEGHTYTKNEDEFWQLKLWSRLTSYWKEQAETKGIPGRVKAYLDVKKWLLKRDKVLFNKLPEYLFVFGLSHLNRPFIEIISEIASTTDVYNFSRSIHFPNISEKSRELFLGWAASANAQKNLLNELVKRNNVEKIEEALPCETNYLPNIGLHSCHSVRREVEVLKDEVLRFLDTHTETKASDILVMVPDADEYLPLIESVFNGAEREGDPILPVSKLSRWNKQWNEHALITLFDVLNSSFKPSLIIDILTLQPIKDRFGFSDDEIALLEEWIDINRIHRGIGDSFNAPYSWQKGLNQIISGFVMEPGDLEIYRELVPLIDVSSSEDLSLIARFSSFMHSILNCVKNSNELKTPLQWLHFTENILSELLECKNATQDLSGIYRIIGKLKEQVSYAVYLEKIPYTLAKNWLKKQFNSNHSASGRFGQGITVSTYIPYRSVPFNFIGILGLNEGVFPRRSVRPEFDLIYNDPQPGDRIQSEDDTYLFLETLFAAQDQLHVSYKGQDQRSDTHRLPSMLIQQLKEALPAEKISTTQHKLHAFNSKYFTDQKKQNHGSLHKSYSLTQKKLSVNLQASDKIKPYFIQGQFLDFSPENKDNIAITDLIDYFVNPSKYMLTNYLGLTDKLFQNEIEDREMFDLNGLNRYKVDNLLFDSLQNNIEKEEVYAYLNTVGLLPDKLKGKRIFNQEYEQISSFIECIHELMHTHEKNIELKLNLNGVEFFGTVKGLYGNSFISYRVGERRAEHEIQFWILQNAILASGYPLDESFYLSVDKKKNKPDVLHIKSDMIDEGVFEDLTKWYLDDRSLLESGNFFPKTSKEFASRIYNGDEENYALSKAKDIFLPDFGSSYAESTEYFTKLLWRNIDPLENDDFKSNALRFWIPFLKAVKGSNE